MKKIFTVLKISVSVLLLTVALIAISADVLSLRPFSPSDQDIPQINDPENIPNDDTQRPDGPFEDIPNWSIIPTVVRNTLTDTSGNILCEMRYSYPCASANDSSDISSFISALDTISGEIKNYVEKRSELYKTGSQSDFSVPPQITGYYTVNRFSTELFSITFVFSEISPEGNVGLTKFSYNLDLLLSSRTITIDAVLNDPIKTVSKALLKLEDSGDLALFSNYENILAAAVNDVWHVGADRITFTFPAGKIAPMSSGEISISVKGQELVDSLSEYGKILMNVS